MRHACRRGARPRAEARTEQTATVRGARTELHGVALHGIVPSGHVMRISWQLDVPEAREVLRRHPSALGRSAPWCRASGAVAVLEPRWRAGQVRLSFPVRAHLVAVAVHCHRQHGSGVCPAEGCASAARSVSSARKVCLHCNVPRPQTPSNGAMEGEGGGISLSKSPIATSKTAFDSDKRTRRRPRGRGARGHRGRTRHTPNTETRCGQIRIAYRHARIRHVARRFGCGERPRGGCACSCPQKNDRGPLVNPAASAASAPGGAA